jgi:transcriptional regulator with XRE-family HTH domain
MGEVSKVLRRLMEGELIDGRPISENELARRTDVPQPTIHRILTGESRYPTPKTLKPLADYFGVSMAQIWGEEPLPSYKEPLPFPEVEGLTFRQRVLVELFEALPESEQDALIRELEAKKHKYERLYEELSKKRKKAEREAKV